MAPVLYCDYMTIKNILEDLTKKVKVYESKIESKESSQKPKDKSMFTEEQKKLESELLLLQKNAEKDKSGEKKALESIVLNGQVSDWKTLGEADKQHFEKAFEGIKAEYKGHDIVAMSNHNNSDQEHSDAYHSDNKHENMHSHYHSDSNPKEVYKSNNPNGY